MTSPYLTPDELEQQDLLDQASTALPVADAIGASVPEAGLPPVQQAPGAAAAAQPVPGAIPMPPPQVPGLPDFSRQIQDFSSQWLAQGNQYLSPLATATRAESTARLAEGEATAGRKIDEFAASRGLIGSSYEGEQRVDLEGELQRARGEDERALQQMLADRESLDKESAGRFGLDLLNSDERRRQFDVTAGFTQQDIDQRAEQILNEGRALDLQEARDIASRELGVAALGQGGQQFAANLEQRQTEFASTIGLTREQFETQTAQFQQQFGEQVASRLQQNEQFSRALESDEVRNALSVGLQSRALDLQEAGMTMEEAWRQASLDQERTLTTRAQDLQEQGIGNDDRYRYAALDQDGDFREARLKLERDGLNMEQSYREAEQGLQLQQLGIQQQQVDQRAEELRQADRSFNFMSARDLAQVDLTREEIQSRLDMQELEIDQREAEFARNSNFNEREFSARQDQFSTQMAEQTASRLQQNTQFTTALQSDAEQNALERGLRTRALDLQESGMGADQAFRQAQQEFENGKPAVLDAEGNVIEEPTLGYQDRVLQLQAEGMESDEAIRWAALESDDTYRAEALRLQELGLTNQESYHEAEMLIREKQLSQQWDIFSQQIEFDRNQMFENNTYRTRVLELQERGLDDARAARQAELEYKERVLQEQREQFDDQMEFKISRAETDDERLEVMLDLWYATIGKKRPGDEDTSNNDPSTNPPPDMPNPQYDPNTHTWTGDDGSEVVIDE